MPIKATGKFNKKGFTLIGVLVASVVGLIVIMGTSQMFVNMSGQLKQMERKAALVFFNEFIGDQLRSGCENTLRNGLTVGSANIRDSIQVGNDLHFHQLRNENDRVVLDLDAEKARLEAEHGITGHTFFQLKCVGYDHDSNPVTPLQQDCDYTSSSVRSRKWTLSFISQRRTKGVLQYNRGMSYELDITYNSDPTVNPGDFDCNILELLACSYVKDDLTLMGCGNTTQNVTDSTSRANKTTAYGYDAGPGALTGKYNTFVGHSTGTNTTGTSNMFLGFQAGKATTVGNNNTFIGTYAGQSNTTGSGNTFLGYNARGGATTSNAVAIGSQVTAGNNQFVVGNSSDTDWLKGTIGTTSLRVNNRLVCLRSSGGMGINCPNRFPSLTINNALTVGGNNVCVTNSAGYGINCPTLIPRLQVTTELIAGLVRVGRLNISEIRGDFDVRNSMTIDGNLTVRGTCTGCGTPSSKTLKKNIRPFKNFQKALNDLLKTPLFTYEYKKDHPEKSRMGIIAEELPEHLQIKDKEKPSKPDWPSIYGSLWAGIKALHELLTELKQELTSKITNLEKALLQKLENLKREVFLKLKNLNSLINGLENRQDQMAQELSLLKAELSVVKKELETTNKKLE